MKRQASPEDDRRQAEQLAQMTIDKEAPTRRRENESQVSLAPWRSLRRSATRGRRCRVSSAAES